MNQDTKIEIKNNVFIVPLITGFTKVVSTPLNKKFAFYVHHSGTSTMLNFDTEEEANEASKKIDLATDEYWIKKLEAIHFSSKKKKKDKQGRYLPPFLRDNNE